MKKLFIFLILLCGLGAQAQTDTVIYYVDSPTVYRIDTSIITMTDTITSDSNYVVHYYDYSQKINDTTFIYQPQFWVIDSLGNMLLPNMDLSKDDWRNSGTVKDFVVDSNFVNLTLIQQRDSLIFNNLKTIYGGNNVKKE